ncbi:hypothetical protein BGZ60DRAFT_438331 [Tricladium varicosporioides]|nr:hypothetical protein BGZ60DRAFT_438331 [Hymenoscyphus varicosporioides]
MTYHNRGIFFSDKILPQIKPTTNVPNKLNHVALLSLPFIGTLCGVDELCPTKCVYAIYDPSTCGLRFVYGDGVFVTPEQVCFLKLFQHQAFLLLLKERSAWHYQQLYQDNNGQYLRELQGQLVVTEASVKAALMYKSDLRSYIGRIPALANHISNPKIRTQKPSIYLNVDPTWDFGLRRVPYQVSQEQHTFLREKYGQFIKKYGSTLGETDFRQAIFYLAAICNAKLINFVRVGDNNRRYFTKTQTPLRPPGFRFPMTTSRGWTVDCFIARFCKFEVEFVSNSSYIRVPNPILWLEAELEDEHRRYVNNGVDPIKPWKGRFSTEQDGEIVPPVLDWRALLALEWVKNKVIQYPKSLVDEEFQELSLHEIVDPKTGGFKESKKAKRDGEKGKTVVDLTRDSAHEQSVGNMHRFMKHQPSQGVYEDIDTPSGEGAHNDHKGKPNLNRLSRNEEPRSPQHMTKQAARINSKSGSITSNEEEEEENYEDFIRRVKTERYCQLANRKLDPLRQALLPIKEKRRQEDIYDDSGTEDINMRKRLRQRSLSPSSPLLQFKDYGGYDEAISPIRPTRACSHPKSLSTLSSNRSNAPSNNFEESIQCSPPQTPTKGGRAHLGSGLISPPGTKNFNNFKFDSRSSAHLLSEDDVLSDDEIERISNPALAIVPSLKKKSSIIPSTPTQPFSSVSKLKDPFSLANAQATKGSSATKSLTPVIHSTAVYQFQPWKADKRSPIQQACDIFESQHRLLPHDHRIVDRMKSSTPTSSDDGLSMKVQPSPGEKDEFVEVDAIQVFPVVKAGARILRKGLKGQKVAIEGALAGVDTALNDDFMDIDTYMAKGIAVAKPKDPTTRKAVEERSGDGVNSEKVATDRSKVIRNGSVCADILQPSLTIKYS